MEVKLQFDDLALSNKDIGVSFGNVKAVASVKEHNIFKAELAEI